MSDVDTESYVKWTLGSACLFCVELVRGAVL